MRIIKEKTLDIISKRIDVIEREVSKEVQENLNKLEKEKLERFSLYHVIRMEKYIRQGGDPTFGNLDGQEYTTEEFEYYLSHMLNDFTPDERYRQLKDAYYWHQSYIEMEKLNHWEDRAKAKYCNGQQCIPACPYYEENGRIEDDQVVKEFIDSTEILEIEDYKKELGEELVEFIINEWNSPKV